MTEQKELRAALIGCGRIAHYHVAALQAIPGVRIVGMCDLDEAMAREKAERYGVDGVFTDPRVMMEKVRPDVVHVLTPPGSHVALTEIVAGHGGHLYVEKPLASTAAEADVMIAAAKRAGVILCPGHNRLFDPPFLEAVRRVERGDIGRVVSVRAEQGFAYEKVARAATIPWSYRYDWGIFDNLMPHALYLATHFLKDPGSPRVTGLQMDRIREADIEELRVLLPSSGAVAEIVMSMTTAPVQNRIEIVGTRGRVVADYVALSTTMNRVTGLPGPIQRLTSGFALGSQMMGSNMALIFGVLTGGVKQYMGLRNLVAELYASIRAGTPPPVSAEDGRLNVRLMDEIKAACGPKLKRRGTVRKASEVTSGPRVLVTGATGFLGGRLVERFSEEGVPVRATTRLASRVRDLPNVEWVTCDLRNESELRGAMQGIETVYHCAAMAGAPGTLKEYEEANVAGTVMLARVAGECGVKDVVYVSSLSVYGAPPKPYVDEESGYETRAADRGFYTQSKMLADQAARKYAAEYATPRLLLMRPGTIYGPGVKLPIGRFVLPSSPNRPIVAGGGGVPMPLTYVDNVLDAMRAAATSSAPTGRVFNVVDEAELDQAGVARTLRQVSSDTIRPWFLPYPIAWSMMMAIDLVSLVRKGKWGTARYRLDRTIANMRYRCERARKELGWSPRVSLAEGFSRVIEAAKERPFPW